MTDNRTPSFLKRVLQIPRYGYERGGVEYFPSSREIILEIFHNVNVFRSRKNWIGAVGFLVLIQFTMMAAHYYANYFSVATLAVGFLIFLIDYPLSEAIVHRGYNHRAFRPRNRFCFFIVKLLGPVDLPEEIFQVAHTVHHHCSDKPGDPYNAKGGLFYNYFTDITHQNINRNLSREDYEKLKNLLKHCMLYQNSYEQYLRWGTVANPWAWSLEKICHFTIRYAPLMFLGKEYFYAYFAAFHFNLFVYYRTVNYFIHGGGKRRQREGIEFHHADLSYNHPLCSFFFSQRHNFHHHYPRSANNAFLPWSIDQAYLWIKFLEWMGIVTDVKNLKKEFLRDHYEPFHGRGVQAQGELR